MAQRDERLTVVSISRVILWLVWAWVVLDVVLLFLAFVLRLFGANPDAGFTEWVYRSVERAMAPFRGIFEPIELNGASVLDTSLLFAMIVYGIVALFLRAGLDWVTRWITRRRYDLAVEEVQDEARAQAAAQARAQAAAQARAQAYPATGAQLGGTTRYPDVVVPSADPSPGSPPPR